MTIESIKMITCDYCGEVDYFYGTNKDVVLAASKNSGWIQYKGKHFDSKECLEKYKEENNGRK